MRTITILGNGEYPRTPYPLWLIDSADFVICCDGAFTRWLRRKHQGRKLPDIVIGDMDSLPASVKQRYADRIIHETEQDDNDQTKAIKYILQRFPDEELTIHIVGATGMREDHTIGNVSLLMEYERRFNFSKRGITCDIVSDYSTIFAITDSCSFDCGAGRAVSVLTPDNSLTIKSQGLVWPTDDVVFDNWWKATLNRASADTVTLTFSHPSYALIILS